MCAVGSSIDSPCTDVPHLSVGAQNMTLDYSVMPAAWFGGNVRTDGRSQESEVSMPKPHAISCHSPYSHCINGRALWAGSGITSVVPCI